MSDQFLWYVPLVLAGGVIIWWFLKCRRDRLEEWGASMRRCGNLPEYMRDCGDGWVECRCTNCHHTFLWWRGDQCACTNCGVDYWKANQQVSDSFEKPPDDWEPMC